MIKRTVFNFYIEGANTMFPFQVSVNIISTTSEEHKYVATCKSSEIRKRSKDFSVEGTSMKEVLTKLIIKMDEFQISYDDIYTVGEFDANLLTEEDIKYWSTSLSRIKLEYLAHR